MGNQWVNLNCYTTAEPQAVCLHKNGDAYD